MLDVPGTYVGLMEAVVLARAGRGAESLNEITHDKPGALQIPRNVLASKRRLDTVWRLGEGCGRRKKRSPSIRFGRATESTEADRDIMCAKLGHELIVFSKDKKKFATRGKGRSVNI